MSIARTCMRCDEEIVATDGCAGTLKRCAYGRMMYIGR